MEFLPCPVCKRDTPKAAIETNGCCMNCWIKGWRWLVNKGYLVKTEPNKE